MPRQKRWSNRYPNSCHVGGNSPWPTCLFFFFFFTQTVLVLFLKGFTSTAAGLCHYLQVETGRVLFFFLQKIMKRSSISVPELFPEMRALQSPGNSLFPASSVGKGLLPKGMSVTESEASRIQPSSGWTLCGATALLSLSTGKRKHISIKPFSQLRGRLVGGRVLLLMPLS